MVTSGTLNCYPICGDEPIPGCDDDKKQESLCSGDQVVCFKDRCGVLGLDSRSYSAINIGECEYSYVSIQLVS